jgi:spermidine synthase
MQASRATLIGIALVCWANLLLEVLVTRLFSATMFYHFTFMAVGLAMFGIAASGVYVFLRATAFRSGIERHLRVHAQLFSVATLVTLVFATRFPVFRGGKVPAMGAMLVLHLLALVVTTALPFFFAGVIVSLALTWFRDDVNRVYASDLVGAAFAAMLAGVVLAIFGGPTAVLVVVAVGCVAAALFERASRWRWLPVGAAIALVAANLIHPFIRVGSVKWEGKLELERWNVFSRITVDKHANIKIDAGASTAINTLRDLKPGIGDHEITALGLATWDTPPTKCLVIGPGGGRDVLFALAAGATDVTGVEINPLIATDIMRGAYADASGGLYTDPRVHIVVDDGRSFVRRSDDRYDFIQASLVDTWAATAAGAFALTENTLYTLEAFTDYFSHLTDRGVVTMTRFYVQGDGEGVAESPRLLILAGGALQTLGVPAADVRKHIFFAVSSNVGTLVAKRTEFTAAELARLEARSALAGLTVLVSPRTSGATQLERYLDDGAWSATVTDARDELVPPTDDRPFFFFFKKFGDLFVLEGKQIYDGGLWVLVSLGAVIGLGVVFIVLPLTARLLRTGTQSKVESSSTQVLTLSYFGIVGFAFMAIEIALMQRFTLFVGHPSYSLLVVLCALLLSTAGGAVLAGRLAIARLGRVMFVVGILLGVLAATYGIVLGPMLRAMIGLERPLRIVITSLLIAPVGLLMGAMIPSIIRLLGAAQSPLVPWGWGVNGATSVIGTSVATVIAIYGGFTTTFFVGAALYAISGVVGAAAAQRYQRLVK